MPPRAGGAVGADLRGADSALGDASNSTNQPLKSDGKLLVAVFIVPVVG